ncbi:MAG: hypothetical protein QM758_05950 [Armatimonas sp.]
MKLTSLEFALIIGTLLLISGSTYKARQNSMPPPTIAIQPAPIPAASPSPEGGRVYMIAGRRNQYFHFKKDCWYWDEKARKLKEPQPCPKCAGGNPGPISAPIATPSPASMSTPGIPHSGPVYMMGGNIYYHYKQDCRYNEGHATGQQRQPCPKCAGG